MARNTSITTWSRVIATLVDNARYVSASEVVRAGLSLLEETQSKLERLSRLMDISEQSGIADSP